MIFSEAWKIDFTFGCSTLVGQHPMKSLSSICLSVRHCLSGHLSLSVHPSLGFLKIGSLVFSYNVHDDS